MTITLTADIGYADSPIPVSADPPTDIVLVDSEQMRVWSHGPTQLGVERGYNSTVKTSHSSGAVVTPAAGAISTTGGVLIDVLVDAQTLEIADVAVTATAAEVNALDGSTATAAELSLEHGAPASVGFGIAAGASAVSTVTITAKNAAGATLQEPIEADVWLSDAATGIGLTSIAPSVGISLTTGTVLGILTAAKALHCQANASGVIVLSIHDASKTGYYVAVQPVGRTLATVSRQLVAGDYGA
jgi:hypothetical protein